MFRIRCEPRVKGRAIPGRTRFSANRSSLMFPAVKAVNQALKETESKVRITIASVSARLAFVRSADALAG